MTLKYCRGCGCVMQSAKPDQPGFVPENVLKKSQVCQRCYQMTHYGKTGKVRLDPEQIENNIKKAIQLSELSVITADFSDLTGTLPAWSSWISDKPYLIVLNKLDLAPERTRYPEIIEYLENYLRDRFAQKPRTLILTSGLKGTGVGILLEEIKKATLPGTRISLLGMTNVGKSSLVKRMLATEKSNQHPTVSKFPGTTLGLSNWSILKGRNTLIDTPGLTPGDRYGDLLCPECATQLVSTTKLSHKLWSLKPGKGIIWGNLFGLAQLGERETVLLSFASPELKIHRTDSAKIGELLTTTPSWLGKACKKCASKLKWQETVLKVDPQTDLAVAGLGWFSIRGAATELKIWHPEGIRWEIRPALVGKKESQEYKKEFLR